MIGIGDEALGPTWTECLGGLVLGHARNVDDRAEFANESQHQGIFKLARIHQPDQVAHRCRRSCDLHRGHRPITVHHGHNGSVRVRWEL